MVLLPQIRELTQAMRDGIDDDWGLRYGLGDDPDVGRPWFVFHSKLLFKVFLLVHWSQSVQNNKDMTFYHIVWCALVMSFRIILTNTIHTACPFKVKTTHWVSKLNCEKTEVRVMSRDVTVQNGVISGYLNTTSGKSSLSCRLEHVV